MTQPEIDRLEHAARTAMAWDEERFIQKAKNGVAWVTSAVLIVVLVALVVRRG